MAAGPRPEPLVDAGLGPLPQGQWQGRQIKRVQLQRISAVKDLLRTGSNGVIGLDAG